MAKTNKYTSINFNHIYDKTTATTNTPSKHHPQPSLSSSSYSAASRSNGRMLVLSRPSPKPLTAPIAISPSQPEPQSQPLQSRSEPGPDPISLRPLGRTGSASMIVPSGVVSSVAAVAVTSPKPNKFVPPHLRPGFAGKEERPGPEVFRGREHPGQKNFGSPGRYGDDGGRPKSGGGYERMRMGGESDLGSAIRPRSSGNRPNSSG